MNLNPIDILVIIAYMGSLSLIGIYFSRRQKSRDEYFLGDRKVFWFLAGGSVLATILSTISYLSVPGEVIRYGFAYCFGLIVAPLVIPIVNRILIPTIKGLEITSAYEYVDRRFDRSTGNLASTLFVFRTLIWSGIIIYTASFAFSEISGLGLFTTIILLGVITTFYTSVGGFRTVIWTDNLQLWILLAGRALHSNIRLLSGGDGTDGLVGDLLRSGTGRDADLQLRSHGPNYHRRHHAQHPVLEYLRQRRRPGGDPTVSVDPFHKSGAALGLGLCLVQRGALHHPGRLRPGPVRLLRPISPTCRWPSFRPRSLPRATGSCRASSPSNFPPEYPAWSWRPCFRRPCPASARPSTPSPAS